MNTFLRSTLLIFLLVTAGFSGLNAQTTLSKANKQYELHAFNLAAKSYQSIIEKQPNNVEALSKLADCFWHLNKMDEAKVYFERAIETGKADPRTYFQYGQTLKAAAQYNNAKQQFQEFGKTYPLEGAHFAESCDFALGNQQSQGDFEVQSESVNTTAADFGPAFFLNDVVFSSSRIDMKRSNGTQSDWTGSANNQLFLATRDQNNNLSQPSFLRLEIRNVFNEGPVAYSPDGRWVVITKNNFVDGTRQIPSSGLELSLFIAEVTDKGDWLNPLPFPHNGPGFSNGYGSFSPDGNAIYFASNRPDGYGGFDLFVSNRVGNSWSSPENLGPAINTVGDEITPYFNGTHLYFASDWHTGFGGFDIFRTQKGAHSWETVFNMGSGINSPRDDYGFIYDEVNNLGYLSSNRVGGKGLEDLYRVQKSLDNIVFYIRNAADRTPVPGAYVDLTACGLGRHLTDNTGTFTFRSSNGLNCNVEFACEGYLNNTLNITTLSGQQGRTFEVLLKKFGDEFFGGVVNVMSGEPIEGTLVRAVSQTNGAIIETYSDQRGSYSLALSPNTTYVVRYSKGGFVDVNRTLRSGDGKDKGILGTISITPSAALMGAPTLMSTNTLPNQKEIPAESSAPSVIVTQGYSVQVAAIEMGRKVDLNSYQNKLSDLGTVYVQEEGKHQKVRLGPFESESEAKMILSKAKTKGYKTAFLVRQAGTAPANVAPLSVPQSYNAASEPVAAGNNAGRILIKLAAYKDLANFQEQKVSDIGIVEKKVKGSFTVVLLTGYASKEEAQKALNTAKQRGFTGAILVTESTAGEFIRMD